MTPSRFVQAALFAAVVRPSVRLVLGLVVENARFLPRRGPAVIVANHNSHLDTLALMSLVPLRDLWKVRPVAAADHFGGSGPVAWIARHVLRTILVDRCTHRPNQGRGLGGGHGQEAALEPLLAALDRGEVLILYPEGTRGKPEALGRFRRGVAALAAARPDVPIVTVGLRGTGKCLPKGSALPVPFSCALAVGEPEDLRGVPSARLPDHLRARVEALSRRAPLGGWDEEDGHGLGDTARPASTAA